MNSDASLTQSQTNIKWSKRRAGTYVASGRHTYVAYKHEGLTWQDRPYWILEIDGIGVLWNNGQSRSRRFRLLADVKAYVAELPNA
jgi:hypothetical protein